MAQALWVLPSRAVQLWPRSRSAGDESHRRCCSCRCCKDTISLRSVLQTFIMPRVCLSNAIDFNPSFFSFSLQNKQTVNVQACSSSE